MPVRRPLRTDYAFVMVVELALEQALGAQARGQR
jgi:hypothetical protein